MKNTKVTYRETCNGLVLKSELVSHVTVKLRLTLPSCLMPSYFQRHKLCKKDVETILGTLPPRDVWLLGIAIGAANLAPSCFRTAYSSLSDILITSKVTVRRNILNKFDHLFQINRDSVLDDSAMSRRHDPALPKHFISQSDFTFLSHDIFPNLNIFQVIDVNRLFCYQGKTWIAISFEGDSIFALCTIDEDTYKISRREKYGGLRTKMPTIRVQGQIFKILCDDGILFAAVN